MGWLILALTTAATFWGQHGYTSPCGTPQVVRVPHIEGIYMQYVGSCRIEVPDPAWNDLEDEFKWRTKFCPGIMHEYGHVVGLDHRPEDKRAAPFKIMDPLQYGALWVPRACRKAVVYATVRGSGYRDHRTQAVGGLHHRGGPRR